MQPSKKVINCCSIIHHNFLFGKCLNIFNKNNNDDKNNL